MSRIISLRPPISFPHPCIIAGTATKGASSGYTSTDDLYDAVYAAWLATQTPTSTIWVATNGNDTTGNGSEGSPYATIGKGLSMLSAGSHCVVKNGTYAGAANWISVHQRTIPNGTDATHHTVIRAENRFGVRITQSTEPSNYEDGPVNLDNKSWVAVDGFILDSTDTAEVGDDNTGNLLELSSATNCRATRCLVRNTSCDQYGGGIGYGNNNVIEDCHVFGSYRYAVFGGTGGTSAPAGTSVVRRCIVFGVCGPSLEPTAPFSFYGSNTSGYALCKDVLFANCFALNCVYIPHKSGQNAEDLKWADWYHPKSVRNIEHVGCGSLNGGSEYGAFRTDNYGGASDVLATFLDCWVANNTNGNNSPAFSKASNGLLTITNYTIGNSPGGTVPGSGSTNTNGLTSGATYPMLRSGSNGAEQKYAVGVPGSKWGTTGYKTPQTSLPLWPFPYESYIKALFQETFTKKPQDVPTSPTTSPDLFTGTALGGGSKTITSLMWEAFNNPMPSFAPGAGVY